MTFKQVKDLLDIGFIPSIIIVPSNNSTSNITQIIGYETQTGEYNEEEITTYIVKLANGNKFYARNQTDELSSSLPKPDGGGVVLR